ncbi:hypothetical protein Pyn_28847 [Prunus yedoensis var. nudiflora]|uniref:Uncharacterized protein n=1 Tax=Prunus yedoensis var. nudiflora TaxID=2094558 RepID=A0A314ZDC7_PRUYE|nr:hypothetical protein Pyn_28847 [Prunus yedoensis var. nudiflora]
MKKRPGPVRWIGWWDWRQSGVATTQILGEDFIQMAVTKDTQRKCGKIFSLFLITWDYPISYCKLLCLSIPLVFIWVRSAYFGTLSENRRLEGSVVSQNMSFQVRNERRDRSRFPAQPPQPAQPTRREWSQEDPTLPLLPSTHLQASIQTSRMGM